MKRLTACLFFLFLTVSIFYSQNASNFIVWQLPAQNNYVGNSYVFLMNDGKVVVMDGGMPEETMYLRGFLAALGNEVEAWFLSHPHRDHFGALNEIVKNPGDISIKKIYHSEFPQAYYEKYDTNYTPHIAEIYANLKESGIDLINITKPGKIIQIDKTKFKILSVTNEDITINIVNNNSMVIKVWDQKKSIVFLGDLAKEGGDILLNGPYREDLNCDYLQLAHHGQRGVSMDFYRSIEFKACLWATPLWLWNNDQGEGFNTAHFETVETRNLMSELGIKEHYVSWEGLVRIE